MKSVEMEARQRLQAGRADQAEQILRRQLALTPRDARLREMLGQALASLGRKNDAIAELRIAVEHAPQMRTARLQLARLANEQGQPALAEQHARALTEANAGDSEAWSALGFAAFALGRRHAARDALRKAISVAPEYAAARYNLASVLCDLECSEEALAEAEEAARLGARKRGVTLIRARSLIQLDRLDEAEQVLGQLLGENPVDGDGHRILVQLRQLRGDSDPLRDLRVAAHSKAPPTLRMAFGDALRRSGDLASAAEVVRGLITELGRAPQLLSSLAVALQESGQVRDAFELSREALAGASGDVGIAETFVATAIATGHAADALPVVEQFRAARPLDQSWITYRIDIARLRGEHEFDDWFDPRVVTRTIDLPTPSGYRDQGEFNTALAAVLTARHRHQNHPLDQSLRHGTQTSRNLLIQPEPAVAQLLASFSDALAEYQQQMGSGDTHPLKSRNSSRATLVGCWSVRLRRGGFHVNHIHPEGWVSSAYYVTVPDEAADEHARAGWLKFGEPRFPVEGLSPLAFVQPKPGRLVLFPSYMWHGTNALRDEAPRMSVAFDALPHSEIK
jgi:Flp pilus assembly protein TadD